MKNSNIRKILGSAMLIGLCATGAAARVHDGLLGNAVTSADATCFGHSSNSGGVGLTNSCGTDATTKLWDMSLIWDAPQFAAQPLIRGKVTTGTPTHQSCTHNVFDVNGNIIATSGFPNMPRNSTYSAVTASVAVAVGLGETSVIRCSLPGGLASRISHVDY